jgi:hypothetical protein
MVLDKKCELTNPVITNLFEEEKVLFSNLVGVFLRYDKLGEKCKELKKEFITRELNYNPFKYINAHNYIRSNLSQYVSTNHTTTIPKEQPKEKVIYNFDDNQKVLNDKVNNIVNNLKDDKKKPQSNQTLIIPTYQSNMNDNYQNDFPSINQITQYEKETQQIGEEFNIQMNNNMNTGNINNFQQINHQFSNLNVNPQSKGSFGYNEYIHSNQVRDINKPDVNNNPMQHKNNIIDDLFRDL